MSKPLELHKIHKGLLDKVGSLFILHSSQESWGGSVLIMEKKGRAFCRTYWYADDNSTVYFDWLSVDKDAQKRGLATKLLNAHIKTAGENGVASCLWVKKGTWVHEWYKRKGYVSFKDNENEVNGVWLRKK